MTHTALGVPLEGPPAADENLLANQRYRTDTSAEKVNLAIGSNVGADGKPWTGAVTYPEVLSRLAARGTACGSYTTPDAGVLAAAKESVCELLNVPSSVRSRTVVSWATGGGSGAVNRAIAFIRAQHRHEDYTALTVQADSWPGYGSVAYASGWKLESNPIDLSTLPEAGLLVAQTVHNGTGRLLDGSTWRTIGTHFASRDRAFILDAPYTGFDFCDRPYADAIQASAAAIRALVDAGAPVVIAFGPTKIFNTFAYRPGGATIVVCRTAEEAAAADARMKRVERGSTGFVDIATLALVEAMATNPDGLRRDHAAILARLAEATGDWRAHTAGSALANYFTPAFGGLFRIVPIKAGAIERLAAAHIHVVNATTAAGPRCRINVMGLPHDRAEEIVTAVAREVIS